VKLNIRFSIKIVSLLKRIDKRERFARQLRLLFRPYTFVISKLIKPVKKTDDEFMDRLTNTLHKMTAGLPSFSAFETKEEAEREKEVMKKRGWKVEGNDRKTGANLGVVDISEGKSGSGYIWRLYYDWQEGANVPNIDPWD
jgi:hypothetical protein